MGHCVVMGEHFPKRKNLDSPKLKKFANDFFKFDENGGKFSKSNFPLFPQ